MNTNSNSYTIIYASVMVVIVAFLLAFVSSSLRETQNKNVELDTKKQILAALNIKDVKDAEAEYNKYEVSWLWSRRGAVAGALVCGCAAAAAGTASGSAVVDAGAAGCC